MYNYYWERGKRNFQKRRHKIIGHNATKGTNGWENLGTGYYCTCGEMVYPDGRLIEKDYWTKYARQRES